MIATAPASVAVFPSGRRALSFSAATTMNMEIQQTPAR